MTITWCKSSALLDYILLKSWKFVPCDVRSTYRFFSQKNLRSSDFNTAVICMDIFLDVITVNLDDFQDWPANVPLVVVAASVSSTRTTFQSFHHGNLRRGFGFLRGAGLGLSHMTARHWVKMLQSEAVSLEKFVMGEPGWKRKWRLLSWTAVC